MLDHGLWGPDAERARGHGGVEDRVRAAADDLRGAAAHRPGHGPHGALPRHPRRPLPAAVAHRDARQGQGGTWRDMEGHGVTGTEPEKRAGAGRTRRAGLRACGLAGLRACGLAGLRACAEGSWRGAHTRAVWGRGGRAVLCWLGGAHELAAAALWRGEQGRQLRPAEALLHDLSEAPQLRLLFPFLTKCSATFVRLVQSGNTNHGSTYTIREELTGRVRVCDALRGCPDPAPALSERVAMEVEAKKKDDPQAIETFVHLESLSDFAFSFGPFSSLFIPFHPYPFPFHLFLFGASRGHAGLRPAAASGKGPGSRGVATCHRAEGPPLGVCPGFSGCGFLVSCGCGGFGGRTSAVDFISSFLSWIPGSVYSSEILATA